MNCKFRTNIILDKILMFKCTNICSGSGFCGFDFFIIFKLFFFSAFYLFPCFSSAVIFIVVSWIMISIVVSFSTEDMQICMRKSFKSLSVTCPFSLVCKYLSIIIILVMIKFKQRSSVCLLSMYILYIMGKRKVDV